MKKKDLTKFKNVFEKQKKGILYNDRILRDDFNVSGDDRLDELDQATTDIEQSMRMRLRNREMLYLKKIDDALRRIEEKIFGLCDMCEEQIEMMRLEARPTANLCLSCKEEQERAEVLTAAGRKHKSLGETFSKKFA